MIPAQQQSVALNKAHRVLIVDDSKAMCAFLKKVIDADPALTVVGCALDPYEARDMIKELDPDILTLDIEMPRMDGITFLKNLMRLRPMPVVMISSMTSAGAAISLEALSIGAIDFMVKRQIHSEEQLKEYTDSIRDLVRSAANTTLSNAGITGRVKKPESNNTLDALKTKLRSSVKASSSVDKIICIGASTGGPEAVKHVLQYLDLPHTAVVVTQHMPTRFIGAFAERLNKSSNCAVEVSYEDAPLRAGMCYVAAGESHTVIENTVNGLVCKLVNGDKVNGHQPAVDVLFRSAANILGTGAVGLLLTGMGNDGAAGLKEMHQKGCVTIAQDEKTSAVWGMPGSAVRLEAVDAVLPLQEIGEALTGLLKR